MQSTVFDPRRIPSVSYPVSLGLGLLLESAGLVALARFGWQRGARVMRIVSAMVLPLLAATLRGVFAAPRDPGRSRQAVVAIIHDVVSRQRVLSGRVLWLLRAQTQADDRRISRFLLR